MVFHEITREAIERALEDTREIDERLVDAQETRRILDRLYGYEVSPVLWKKVDARASRPAACSRWRRGSSSSASASGWRSSPPSTGTSQAVRSRRVRRAARRRRRRARRAGARLRPDGRLQRRRRSSQLDEATARALAERPRRTPPFAVQRVERKPYTRRPAAPFMTSTLQQEASRKLRFSAQTTMRVAQRLYENGYITYMRTDSTTLSRVGARGRARPGARALRRRLRPRRAAAATTARSRTRRRRTRRSGPPATASARPTQLAASSRATSSRSTS